MILSSIITFARVQSQTDSNGLSDDNAIVFANEALQDFHRRLVTAGVDASGVQEASILGSSSISSGVYNYPSQPSMLFLKSLEANYTDTANTNFLSVGQIDTSNLPGGASMSWLRANQSVVNPKFDDRGNVFEIIPANPQLMRLFFFAQPSIYTSSISTIGYPENIDPAILGFRTGALYKYSLQGEDNYVAGDKLNAKYEERVKQYIATLGRGSQQPIQPVGIQVDGWQF